MGLSNWLFMFFLSCLVVRCLLCLVTLADPAATLSAHELLLVVMASAPVSLSPSALKEAAEFLCKRFWQCSSFRTWSCSKPYSPRRTPCCSGTGWSGPAPCSQARSRPAPCQRGQCRISSAPGGAWGIGPALWLVHRIWCSSLL